MERQLINAFAIIILTAFAIRSLRNTLYHLFLWQNKEYRLDRMLLHFRTAEGKRFLFGPFSLSKLVLLLVFNAGALTDARLITDAAIWLFAGIILLEATRNLRELLAGTLPLPVFSPKIIVILTVSLFSQLIFVLTSSPRLALDYLPFLDKALGISIAAQIGIFSIPARIMSLFFQLFAREKISQCAALKVIGISGSYGKTSTKEFIAQLLGKKYSVVKTPANLNTAAGVAKTILTSLKADTDYFLLEAAAYKRGEIKTIVDMVRGKLKMAVMTGLNAQHLELFGSLDNIAAAKYELIQALERDGLAIFNGNNPKVRKLAQRAKSEGWKVLVYGNDQRLAVHATDVRVEEQKVVFTLHLGKQIARIGAPLLGRHNIENVLAAAAVAFRAGVSWKAIVGGVKRLQPPAGTMRYRRCGKTILIDDSYNANPDGVTAALEYLSIYDCPKIMVLRPLIELGNKAEIIHQNIGRQVAQVCELLILTNQNYYKSLLRGAAGGKRKVEIVFGQGLQAQAIIEQKFSGRKVILFEGREAAGVLQQYV